MIPDLPIPIGDLKAIEGIVRGQDMFCTSFPDQDVYSITLYHAQAEMYGTHAWMVLDRNVFARIVELAKGCSATLDHRIAAAVMVFARCAKIDFEPTLAVHEGVATQSENDSLHDLAMFRAAANVHPSEFAEIALTRSSRLLGKLLPAQVTANLTASTQRIRQYSFVYPLVLKMGLIEIEGGPMADRMRRFLDWTYSNWYMSAPATALAAMCFSGVAPKGALENLRNRDRTLAPKGLRNCAWDLTYVTWWGELLKRQSREQRLHLFCTRDKALRRVAQQILVKPHSAGEEIAQELRQLLGTAVYDYYAQLAARHDDPGRAVNRVGPASVDLGRQLASALEQQLQNPV